MKNSEVKEIGLYIHIPFCKKKCYYCDFVSFANKEEVIPRYINCLKQEIIQYADENEVMSKHNLEPRYRIKTIYIGGGTPSILYESYIEGILEIIKQKFEIAENPEITIEVNPGTVNSKKLEVYRKCGINRLSIGLQTTQDELLKKIGRIHNYNEFENTYQEARKVGFNNINVDLMINLPNQTMENLKESIKKIISLKPEHISVYSLIVEPNTKMEELVNSKEVELASDEEEREMYWYVKKTLEKNKYIHYEISNFAKLGFESKHNLDCWNQKEYIGVGLAASSYLENKRYSNIENLEEYVYNIENKQQNLNLVLDENQDLEIQMNEYMMLGLRKIDGININEFKIKFGVNPIIKYCTKLEKLTKQHLIKIDESSIKLTNKGIDLANLVWEEFV
jgi:oxygen-independent coproporphyrinogen-3 oxidase